MIVKGGFVVATIYVVLLYLAESPPLPPLSLFLGEGSTDMSGFLFSIIFRGMGTASGMKHYSIIELAQRINLFKP